MAYFYNSAIWLEHSGKEPTPLKLGQRVIAPPLHPNSCLTPKGIVLAPQSSTNERKVPGSGSGQGSDLRLWCYAKRARNVIKQNSYLRTLKSPYHATPDVKFALMAEDFNDELPDLFQPRANLSYDRSRSTPANIDRFRLSNLDPRNRLLKQRVPPKLDVEVSRPPGLGSESRRGATESPCRVNRFSENAFKPSDRYHLTPGRCPGFRTKSAMERALRSVVGTEKRSILPSDTSVTSRPFSMTQRGGPFYSYSSNNGQHLQSLTTRSAGARIGAPAGSHSTRHNGLTDLNLKQFIHTSTPSRD